MKSVALILCLTVAGTWAASLESTHRNSLGEARTKCQSEPGTHVDEGIWAKIQKDEQVEFPSNWGAHILCISKATGLQKEDGSVNEEGIKARIAAATSDEEAINKAVKTCAVAKDTPELTARGIFKCFRELDKKHKN